MGKKVIITGATGMVGSLVLQHCLENDDVEKVISLLRRPSGIEHTKLEEIIVEDFTDLNGHIASFHRVDIVYYCLGVYTGAVDRGLFYKITVDYPETLAKAVIALNPDVRFILLSGGGVDRSEKSRFMFAKDKGIIENRLSKMPFNAFHALRPGYIYPVTPRAEPNFSYKFSRWIYPIIKLMGEKYSVQSTQLAAAIFRVGLCGYDEEILENDKIVQLAKGLE